MTIQLNGEPYELAGPVTLSALLESLDLDARRVAVERNFAVVKRGDYSTTTLHERDAVEIVNFVGGG